MEVNFTYKDGVHDGELDFSIKKVQIKKSL